MAICLSVQLKFPLFRFATLGKRSSVQRRTRPCGRLEKRVRGEAGVEGGGMAPLTSRRLKLGAFRPVNVLGVVGGCVSEIENRTDSPTRAVSEPVLARTAL